MCTVAVTVLVDRQWDFAHFSTPIRTFVPPKFGFQNLSRACRVSEIKSIEGGKLNGAVADNGRCPHRLDRRRRLSIRPRSWENFKIEFSAFLPFISDSKTIISYHVHTKYKIFRHFVVSM